MQIRINTLFALSAYLSLMSIVGHAQDISEVGVMSKRLPITSEPLGPKPHDKTLLVKLDSAQQAWSTAKPTSYRFKLVAGAGSFGWTEYRISVRKGECTAQSRYVWGQPRTIWKHTSCEGIGMPDLFTRVRNSLLRGTYSAEATFDDTLGYIKSISIDPITDLSDQDWSLEVSSFKSMLKTPNKTIEPTR
jgi:hypothetical protein